MLYSKHTKTGQQNPRYFRTQDFFEVWSFIGSNHYHNSNFLKIGHNWKKDRSIVAAWSCLLYKPLVFEEINQYYSTCQSLLLLCLGCEKVEFRTHKSLPYWENPRLIAQNNQNDISKMIKQQNSLVFRSSLYLQREAYDVDNDVQNSNESGSLSQGQDVTTPVVGKHWLGLHCRQTKITSRWDL